MQRKWRLAGIAGFLLTAFLLSASPVFADCFGANNGVAVALQAETAAKGLQAAQDLSPAIPHSFATNIVHPIQVVGTDDFVAIGTFVGAGTNVSGAISNCGANSGTRWAIYVDGSTDFQYFCRTGSYGSEAADAQDQHAEIIHTTCGSATEWTFTWNSAVKTCETTNDAGGFPVVGAESVGYDPQTFDVRDQSLTYRVLGGTWTAWYLSGETSCLAFHYSYTMHSASDYSFYSY